MLAPDRVTWLIALATGFGPGPDDLDFRLRQAHAFWYQWWFHTSGGRLALEQNRARVCEYLWRIWSPRWRFQPDEFAAVASSFQNEQFVDTVIHYYQHRRGAAPGRPRYESQEAQLGGRPTIPVPTTFICGTADTCNLPESYRGNESFFPAGIDRIELSGVGHFVQRECPDVVAEAVRRKWEAHRPKRL